MVCGGGNLYVACVAGASARLQKKVKIPMVIIWFKKCFFCIMLQV